jgi:superfamily II DNA or RNA helicase
MLSKLPQFRTAADKNKDLESPEQLFYKLSDRAKSHGYLRGPQQDVLREFNEKFKDVADLALELPTGTGKTAVALLIAEWRRLTGRKVAFLCLTNQLASQVIDEGKRLGIECADLRGTLAT